MKNDNFEAKWILIAYRLLKERGAICKPMSVTPAGTQVNVMIDLVIKYGLNSHQVVYIVTRTVEVWEHALPSSRAVRKAYKEG